MINNDDLTTEINGCPMCAICQHCPLPQERHGNTVSVPRQSFYCPKAGRKISSPNAGGMDTCYDFLRLL